ncbi:Tenascin-N [Holothuria leucospilota]|uniref:Tenascin-N n=1 Tax=Holothuria leucospilota TaxID=206669 RepID=A0A9Q1BUJ1_HOLLE|nr:Tenascin-N [Holothuria leucospilota]
MPFSTYDRDMNMTGSANCAETNHGGWWLTDCHTYTGMCYLNRIYGESQSSCIRWFNSTGGQYYITSTEMKIRPVD